MILSIVLYLVLGTMALIQFSLIGYCLISIKKHEFKNFIEIPILGLISTALFVSLSLFVNIPYQYSAYVIEAFIVCSILYMLFKKDKKYHFENYKSLVLFIKEYRYLFASIFIFSGCLIFINSSSSVTDPWGSGDFFFYWSNSDYLFSNTLSKDFLLKTSSYPVENLKEHIISPPWVRWGAFGIISIFKIFQNDFNSIFMNPIISLCIFLSIGTIGKFINFKELTNLPISIAVGLTSFNLFSLYYTYLSQVIAVLFLLFYIYLNHFEPQRHSFFKALSLAAIFYTHEVLTSLVIFVIFSEIVITWLKNDKKTHFLDIKFWIYSVVLVAPVSLKVINSVLYAASKRPLVGWEWQRLPLVSDLLGLTSPLIYQLGRVGNFSYALAFITSTVIIIYLYYINRNNKSYRFLSLIAANIILIFITYKFVFTGERNGTHAVWKMFSLFPYLYQLLIFQKSINTVNVKNKNFLKPLYFLFIIIPAYGFATQSFTAPWFSGSLKDAIDIAKKESSQLFIFPEYKRNPYIHSMISLFDNRDIYKNSFINGLKFIDNQNYCKDDSSFIIPANKTSFWQVKSLIGDYAIATPPVDYDYKRKSYQMNIVNSPVTKKQRTDKNKALSIFLSKIDNKRVLKIVLTQMSGSVTTYVNNQFIGARVTGSNELEIEVNEQTFRRCANHVLLRVLSHNTKNYPQISKVYWK